MEKEFGAVGFTHVMVIASNDLNEETIEALILIAEMAVIIKRPLFGQLHIRMITK